MPVGGGDVRADREKPHTIMAAVHAVEGVALVAILHGLAERQARIALEPLRFEDHVLDRHPVHADEAVAEDVETHAILGLPVDELDLEGLGVETDVRRHLERRPLRMGRTRDRAAAEPGGEVDLAVPRSDGGSVHPQLRAARRGEAGEQDLALVGDAVAVVIFQEKHIRRTGDDEPAAPGQHTVREGQPIREDGAFIHPTIAIGVLEQGDDARGLLPFLRTDRVAAVLGHEKSALGVESDGARRGDQGLGGDEFDAQPRGDFERLLGVVRRERTRQGRRGEHAGEQDGGGTNHFSCGGWSP